LAGKYQFVLVPPPPVQVKVAAMAFLTPKHNVNNKKQKSNRVFNILGLFNK